MKQRIENLHLMHPESWLCLWLAVLGLGIASCSDDLDSRGYADKEPRYIKFSVDEEGQNGSRVVENECVVSGRQIIPTSDDNLKLVVSAMPTRMVEEVQTRASKEQIAFREEYAALGFGAYAYELAEGVSVAITSDKELMGDNRQVTWNAEDKVWTPNPSTVKWPENDKQNVSFFCYAPYDEENCEVTPASSGASNFKFEYTVSKTEGWKTLFSVAQKTQSAALDTYVTLNFQPISTTVKFEMKDDLTALINSVEEVTLNGIYSKVTCLYNNTTGKYDFVVDETIVETYTDASGNKFAEFNLVPQSSMSDGAMFVMSYKDTDNNTRKLYADLSKMKWESGYTYTYTLTTKGDEIVELLPEANCYMIDALRINDYGYTYAIPISQAEKGWNRVKELVSSETYDGTGIASGEWTILSEWIDEQHPEALIDGKKMVADDGKTYLRLDFTGVIPNGANAVVSLKVDGTVRWSWHLWFTDYKPYKNNDPNQTEGGQVHSYIGASFTVSGGIYKQPKPRYMMDRNLGATITEVGEKVISLTAGEGVFQVTTENMKDFYGLYYQFGRKDPFGNSETISSTTVTYDNKYLASSIKNPRRFYAAAESYLGLADSMWNPETGVGDGVKKSVFDPCPFGWRVPTGGDNALLNPWAGWGNGDANSTTKENPGILEKFFDVSPMGGIYSEEKTTAWYPAAGWRTSQSTINGQENNSFNQCYWTAMKGNNYKNAVVFFFSKTYVAPNSTMNRASGLPIRCIRDKE